MKHLLMQPATTITLKSEYRSMNSCLRKIAVSTPSEFRRLTAFYSVTQLQLSRALVKNPDPIHVHPTMDFETGRASAPICTDCNEVADAQHIWHCRCFIAAKCREGEYFHVCAQYFVSSE